MNVLFNVFKCISGQLLIWNYSFSNYFYHIKFCSDEQNSCSIALYNTVASGNMWFKLINQRPYTQAIDRYGLIKEIFNIA